MQNRRMHRSEEWKDICTSVCRIFAPSRLSECSPGLGLPAGPAAQLVKLMQDQAGASGLLLNKTAGRVFFT